MKKLLLLHILLFLFTNSSISQINIKSQIFTHKEREYISNARSLYKEFRKNINHYRRDSAKIQRVLKKQYKNESLEVRKKHIDSKLDSLWDLYKMDEKYKSLLSEKSRIDSILKSSTDRNSLLTESEKISDSKFGHKSGYKEYRKIRNRIDKEQTKFSKYRYLTNRDSIKTILKEKPETFEELVENEISRLDEIDLLKEKTSQIDRLNKLPEHYKKLLEQYQSKIYDKTEKLEGIDSQKVADQTLDFAKNHFSKHQDKLGEGMKKLKAIKRKYMSVSNTSDPSDAIKRKSLKGESLIEKFLFGMDIQINRRNENINFEISPIVGWKFNRQISIGISGIYGALIKYNNIDIEYLSDKEVYGYRSFLEFNALRSFFIHGEFERIHHMVSEKQNSDILNCTWSNGLNFGLGKNYSLAGKLQGTFIVLYNAIYERGNSPYTSPWSFRFGIKPILGKVNKKASIMQY